jgi:hypothetical protein
LLKGGGRRQPAGTERVRQEAGGRRQPAGTASKMQPSYIERRKQEAASSSLTEEAGVSLQVQVLDEGSRTKTTVT